MRRHGIPLVLSLLLVTAGCLGSPSGTAAPDTSTPTDTPTDVHTRSDGSTTPESDASSGTASPPAESEVSVAYAVGAGELPEEVESVEVTMAVVFTAHDDGRCWRDTFVGPYKPTITPIKTPDEGDCHRSEALTMDLADLDGNRSLGRFTAPGSYDAGHALVVTDVTATYENGTTVSGLRGADGVRANVAWGRPDGSHHVAFRMDAYEDRPYRYWLYGEVVESSSE